MEVIALWAGSGLRLLLQDFTPFPETEGVQIPIVPLLVSVAGIALLAAFIASALLKPVTSAVVRRRKPKPERPRKPSRQESAAKPAPPPAPPPIQYRKAPIRVEFPQIPPNFPDVWGVGEPIEIELILDSKTLADRATVPGLTVAFANTPLNITFQKGKARVKKPLTSRGSYVVVADLKVKGETLPRRTTRTIKAVVYREEMAEVFDNFKKEASRAIAPIAHDATPWEVLDILMEANPKLPEETLRRIVQGFEEAKFSNHAVTRVSYERMIRALLELERVEL